MCTQGRAGCGLWTQLVTVREPPPWPLEYVWGQSHEAFRPSWLAVGNLGDGCWNVYRGRAQSEPFPLVCFQLGAAGRSLPQFWFLAYLIQLLPVSHGRTDPSVLSFTQCSPLCALFPSTICHFEEASGLTRHHHHCNHASQQLFSHSGSHSKQRHCQLPPSSLLKLFFFTLSVGFCSAAYCSVRLPEALQIDHFIIVKRSSLISGNPEVSFVWVRVAYALVRMYTFTVYLHLTCAFILNTESVSCK